MRLEDSALDYKIVYNLDFSQEGVLGNDDLTIHYDFDIISELGGGRHWVVEHKPTGKVFSIQYFDDEFIADTVTVLNTKSPIDFTDFSLLSLAILNEE